MTDIGRRGERGKRVLMCRPDFYDVEYEINPWMHLDNRVSQRDAQSQWLSLYQLYVERLGWEVSLIEPIAGLPDMVFTANGGLVIGGSALPPCFRHPERQGEAVHFEAWFQSAGFRVLRRPVHDFEGEGDALPWNDVVFLGHPWRSDKLAKREIESEFDREVVPLQLVDARFYHLDTALSVIDDSTVALYPGAFTAAAVETVRAMVPRVILASEDDAIAYGLNAISDGRSVVLSDRAFGLIDAYTRLGYQVCPVSIGEFMKSGGGVKCLTLELRGDAGVPASSTEIRE